VIVLASRSPQRRALLGALGLEYRVAVSGVSEGEDPLGNARAKAEDVAARLGVPAGGAVVGADTEVILDGRALGKPADRAAAAAMLGALGGRAHVVRTGVCVITQRDRAEVCDETRVVFRPLDGPLLDWYLDLGEWRERAGAYAIQGAGAALVERIEGDYTTVVGLPVAALGAALADLGLAPWSAPPAILDADTGGEGGR
jgi:septum formation protein